MLTAIDFRLRLVIIPFIIILLIIFSPLQILQPDEHSNGAVVVFDSEGIPSASIDLK